LAWKIVQHFNVVDLKPFLISDICILHPVVSFNCHRPKVRKTRLPSSAGNPYLQHSLFPQPAFHRVANKYSFTALLRSLERCGNFFYHFPVWKSQEKYLFCLSVWKKKIFRIDLLTYIFIIFYSRWYNFSYIVLNIIVLVCDLGRSCRNIRSEKSPEVSRKAVAKVLKIVFKIA